MDIRNILAPFGNLISQKALVKWTGRRIILPYYHTISDLDLPYISILYPLRTIDQFERDLDYFCKHFTPIDIYEVGERIKTKSNNLKPAFHLTFDDGLKEIHSVIAPILKKRGIPATFFLNTDFIDNKRLFFRYKIGLIIAKIKKLGSESLHQKVEVKLKGHSKWQGDLILSLKCLNFHDSELIDEIAKDLSLDFNSWLQKNTPYLTSTQIEDLIKSGFQIGSHSVDHPRFRNIDLDKQKMQVNKSFQFLENNFQVKERYFSFPFGDENVSLAFFDWMYSEMNCQLSFGVSGIKDDFYVEHLHRIPMDNCIGNTQNFIKSEYLYFMIKSVFNTNKIIRN